MGARSSQEAVILKVLCVLSYQKKIIKEILNIVTAYAGKVASLTLQLWSLSFFNIKFIQKQLIYLDDKRTRFSLQMFI